MGIEKDIINENKVNRIFIIIEPKKNWRLSLSSLGLNIAKSYLKVDNPLSILLIAIKKAADPKTEGEHIREINGIDIIRIIWETKVPPDKVAIFLI